MPLVRISLREGKSAAYRRAIADGVHEAMLVTINVPAADRFQVVTEHGADGLLYDPGYLGIKRTDDVVLIQVTLNQGCSLELKKAFYARVAANLAKSPGLRKEDVSSPRGGTERELVVRKRRSAVRDVGGRRRSSPHHTAAARSRSG